MMNLAYSYSQCPDCGGSGYVVWDGEKQNCEKCDGDGQFANRRGTLKIATMHLQAAESAYDQSERQDGNTYWRGQADKHWHLAGIYATVAQAEALKALAGMEEARLKEILDYEHEQDIPY